MGDEDSDPLKWWRERAWQMPRLAQLALDLFSIPGSSRDVERAFSSAVIRESAGNPKKRGGRPQGPQVEIHSKSNGGVPGERSQCQKAACMRQRLRGKQPPLSIIAYARVVDAQAIHNKAVADRAKAAVADALAAVAEALAAIA